MEGEIVERLSSGVAAAETHDPVSILHANIDGWLSASVEPEVHRIVLIEAPAVLGRERWRKIGHEYGVGLVEMTVQGLIDAGAIPDQPVRPLAHVLVGALEEAALYAARAEDPSAATAEIREALIRLVDGLLCD